MAILTALLMLIAPVRIILKYDKSMNNEQVIRQVAYLLPADIISRLHPCRLNDTNQPVVRTQYRFATLRPTQLASI
jgi:hypothetical protein